MVSIKLKELVTEIFCQIADSNNTILSLSKLIITHTRLATISPELLTNAVLRLEEVNLTRREIK